MAGRLQHEIPQLFQRGFLIDGTGTSERVFVFRRGGKVYPSNIKNSGAERHFYSVPSGDDAETLDDTITDYEQRLAPLVAELRRLSSGELADAVDVAEVVAHLTIRNAHLRGAFTHAYKTMASKVSEVFGSDQALLRTLRLDEKEPGETFKELFAAHIWDDPQLERAELPEPVLERVAFFLAKENFAKTSIGMSNLIVDLSKQMSGTASQIAADGHKKALTQTILPNARLTELKGFKWQAISTSEHLILPDCVAVGIHRNGESHPFVVADQDELVSILLPISSHTLLIGSQANSPDFELGEFNLIAAACSHNYFICGAKNSELESLVGLIGQRSVSIVETALNDSVNQYLPPVLSSTRDLESSDAISEESPEPAELAAPSLSHSFQISFAGDFDQNAASRIGEVVREIIATALWVVPLDRLDGITFSDDYQATLSSLGRGMPSTVPDKEYQNESLLGVAQCPIVLREDVVMCHIVAMGWIARSLIGDDASLKTNAIHIIAYQLAHVGVTQLFDEALPGVLMAPLQDPFQGDLQWCVDPAWRGYLAARTSASFDPDHTREFEANLSTALRHYREDVPTARLEYRSHGDINRLIRIVFPRVRSVLEHAGTLLGHTDGLMHKSLSKGGFVDVLEQMELRAWYEDFQLQLNELWDRRGAWTSYSEFLALNRHAERLLWQFGIFPWKTANGQYRIEIPLASDVEPLSKMTQTMQASD